MAMLVFPEAAFPSAPPARAPAPSWQQPVDPVRAWDELLGGAWAVTEHVAGASTRIILARSARGPACDDAIRVDEIDLAKRRAQGDSVKLIAIEIDRGAPFVSRRVATVMRKLKLKTEADLVALLSERTPAGLTARRIHVDAGQFLVMRYPTPSWLLPPHLTSAERSIVLDLIAGRSRQAIARARATSPRTVANQVAAIFRKLGVESRIGLLVALHRASRVRH